MPGTHLGIPGDDWEGVTLPNSLRVDGQNGSNHVEVTVWGIDSPLPHETRIEVVATGDDPFAINTLTVNAADGDDVVLLSRVTAIPGLAADRPAFVAVASSDSTYERISYDRSVGGKLTVNGLDGDDKFYLDDTSSPLTINGGDGDDLFVIGQFFDTERQAPQVAPEDAFETMPTADGRFLSNGVTRPAVLYGQAGNDRFVVNSNVSELRLEAGTGDDEFIFVTSEVTGLDDDGQPIQIPLPQGFVSVNGGTGESTLVIETTTPDLIDYSDIWFTVVGAGLQIDLYELETPPHIVEPSAPTAPAGLPGEDGVAAGFMVLSKADVPQYVFAGRGSDDLIVITETDGYTWVDPDTPEDSYTIRLAQASTETVYITITSAYGGGLPFAEFSIDGGLNWVLSAVLAILAGDLSEHTVLVRWSGAYASLDDLPEGAPVVTLSHTVSSVDPEFDGIDVRNVYVNQYKEAHIDPDPPTPTPPSPPAPPSPPTRDVPTPDAPDHHVTPVGWVTADGSALAATGAGTSAHAGLAALLLLLLGGLLLVTRCARRQ